jgi:hypothetical protein
MAIFYKKIFLFISISLLCLLSASANERNRFFIFGAGWDPAALEVIGNYTDSNDYVGMGIGKRIARTTDKSVDRVPTPYFLPPSLQEIDRILSTSCSADRRGAVVIYDPEPWDATPKEERDNIFKSIAEAGRRVNNSGCYKFGLAPSRAYLGGKGCQPSATRNFLQSVDWSKVQIFVIQAQGILSDNCGSGNFRNYATFVNSLARSIKSMNPETKVVAELSLSHSDANEALMAITATRENVNGFYLAYPNPSKKNCRYCNKTELEKILVQLKGTNFINK